jgi:hypothetical protein
VWHSTTVNIKKHSSPSAASFDFIHWAMKMQFCRLLRMFALKLHYLRRTARQLEALGRTNRLLSLVRHGPVGIQHLKQFCLAAGTSLPSCYLATTGGYTGIPTDSHLIKHGPHRKSRVQHNSSIVACIHYRGNVFPEPLPSNDRRDTHTDTKTDGWILWSTPLRWAQVPWYTKFHKDWFTHSKVDGRI